ncbi:oxoprolinase 1 [Wolffia australiana]
MASPESKFRFCIDRGGTFTDIYADIPGQREGQVMKLLSVDPANYEDAPIEGIRRILEQHTGQKIPRSSKIPTDRIDWIRMGTTVATNALLERKGERTALCVTRGFRDLLYIGSQARPNIFDLTVSRPSPLFEAVVEADERVDLVHDDDQVDSDRVELGISGELVNVRRPLDEAALAPALRDLVQQGITSLAVVLLHSYTYPHHELRVQQLAEAAGFHHVSLSSSLTPMIRAVPRGLTATVDAYLTPIIRRYLSTFMSKFDQSTVNVLFMQSDGGLAAESRFSGYKAVLSGPAGGVVGYAKTLHGLETSKPLIGFDMGGTSTDVSRYDGVFEHVLEAEIAGAAIQAPQLDITTVAAGGGSKLEFRFGSFRVGPESVGAHPGPVCYRKGGQLALTDANLVLGRVDPAHFPAIFGPGEDQPLDLAAARAAFETLTSEVNAYRQAQDQAAPPMTVEDVALGFIQVANEAMCRPIRQLTEMKGHETRNHALACFGGAGPQHACAVARALGMSLVFVHRFCGILSAYGMGLADVVEDLQEPFAAVLSGDEATVLEAGRRAAALTDKVKLKLVDQGFTPDRISVDAFLHLRYEGTDTAIMVKLPGGADTTAMDLEAVFVGQFQREYGFRLENRNVVVSDVRARGVGETAILKPRQLFGGGAAARPAATCQVYFTGGWRDTPLFKLEEMGLGQTVAGPALIMNGNSTVVVEPGCTAAVTPYGNIRIEVDHSGGTADAAVDVVHVSIFNHRFMGIAEQMGRALQRTAVSTNIKERLDFSCALFGPDGSLVANAPHVPVHLGSMSAAVKWQIAHWAGDLAPGDVVLSNHPAAGGTHLPDITVITPVFAPPAVDPIFFVASRGHHADIGGATPGSMPPFSKLLSEEGAAVKSFKLVRNGVFQESEAAAVLRGTRRLADNLSDLKAQVAANQRGISLIHELVDQYTLPTVHAYMGLVQANAESAVRAMLRRHAGRAAVEDFMDDGAAIRLTLTVDEVNGSAVFDFAGTTEEVYGNWNAPPAVTVAAVIYSLRAMLGEDIPLNQGCLAAVRIAVPAGSLLAPSDRAAVVGGNVLTSQRVTDVVLAAFRACAGSQGCMNNLTFGDGGFGYYETVGGGAGAGPGWAGASAVQCHMTNTRITDPEILERRYPVRVRRFGIREGSGGAGRFRGGDGIVREIEFRRRVTVSVLSERRVFAPRGANGGGDGAKGVNLLVKKDGRRIYLGGKNSVDVDPGDAVLILTPGGGGWGSPVSS